MTITGAVHCGTVSVATLLSLVQLPLVARTQKRVVVEIGPVKRIVPKLTYSSDGHELREELLVGHAAEERGDERGLFDRRAPFDAGGAGRPAARRRVIASPELRMESPTLSRELLPRSVRYADVSVLLGERPRTSLNTRLIQLEFVEPPSAKYSGDAMICASICSSVIPDANAGAPETHLGRRNRTVQERRVEVGQQPLAIFGRGQDNRRDAGARCAAGQQSVQRRRAPRRRQDVRGDRCRAD